MDIHIQDNKIVNDLFIILFIPLLKVNESPITTMLKHNNSDAIPKLL